MSVPSRMTVRNRAARPSVRLLGWGLAGLFGLSACMAAPMPVEPVLAIDPPPRFTQSGDAPPSDCWWRTFGDPVLTMHVERALAANHDLASVWHAFREARAVARRSGADRLPSVDLFANAEVARSTGDGDDETVSAGAAADFEVDLWGRLEASRRADVFLARASLDEYRAAAVSLTAEVARAWFRLVEAELQVALLGEQIEANRQILTLIEPRVAAQQLRSVDLIRQEALIESTRESRIEAEADARILRHQLAVLTGEVPGRIPPADAPALVPLPALPDTGVPIERIRRRPDVRAARHRVLSGDQALGAALRDRFPRLSISASLGSADGVFRDFLASFAAGLLAPIFDGGRLAAEVDRTRARRDRLGAEYAQAVLIAFREVEDALVEEARQRRRIASLDRQIELSERASSRLRDEYLNGQGSYIEVLTALTDEQELRREMLEARRLLIESRIGLHRALAGGFTATCDTTTSERESS